MRLQTFVNARISRERTIDTEKLFIYFYYARYRFTKYPHGESVSDIFAHLRVGGLLLPRSLHRVLFRVHHDFRLVTGVNRDRVDPGGVAQHAASQYDLAQAQRQSAAKKNLQFFFSV